LISIQESNSKFKTYDIVYIMKYSLILLSLLLFSCDVKDENQPELLLETVPETIPAHLDIPPDIYKNSERPSLYEDGDGGGNLKIAHVSDIHHYAPSLYDAESEGFSRFALNNEGRTVLYTSELLESLKQDLISRNVNILLISGDLSILGAEETHLDTARILNGFKESGIRVFVTTGNHDVNNPMAFRIIGNKTEPVNWTTPGEFREIYNEFGFSESLLIHDESLSYLAELGSDYYLLSLDTSWYQDNAMLDYSPSSGVLVPSLFDFVSEAMDLADKEEKQVIVMSHHNFLAHYETEIDLSTFMIQDGERMAELLSGTGVKLALSGHIHKTDIKKKMMADNPFWGATVSSLAIYPHSYRLIGLHRGGAGISTVKLPLNFGLEKNRKILNYNWYIAYDRTFMGQYERLIKDHEPEDALAMAEYFYLINLYAQQGLEEYIPRAVLESRGAPLYKQSESFLKEFAEILPLDSPPGDRNVRINWE